MNLYQSLEDVASEILEETGVMPKTVEQVVDGLTEIGRRQYDDHDDFLSLRVDVPSRVQALAIEDADEALTEAEEPTEAEVAENVNSILNEANTIFKNLQIGNYRPQQ